MNVKLLVGIVLFVIGLPTAVIGIAGVGRADENAAPAVVVENNRSQNLSEAVAQMTIPLIAGFSLAVGGLLIGLSVGNWKNPRTKLSRAMKWSTPRGTTR